MPENNKTIIAIDGYSSCGKSTFARLIAQELGFVYIDSGAMYRSVALYCLENGIISDGLINLPRLLAELDRIEIRFCLNPGSGMQETWLNDVNVEEKIRGIAVSSVVSNISQIADKLASLHDDPKKTAQLGEQARNRVVDLFLWEKYMERYINAVSSNT